MYAAHITFVIGYSIQGPLQNGVVFHGYCSSAQMVPRRHQIRPIQYNLRNFQLG
jgi:hypothetical protein